MGIPATVTGVGGWTVGPIVGRRPAGTARDAVHPGTGARGVLVVVDGRFTGRGLPDPETVARAAIVGSPAVMPMLDAGLLEDGARWYVTPASPGPVLDPAAGCSPRRAATIVESVARALAAVHAAGLVHGLIGPNVVVPAAGRHAERPVGTTLLLDTGVAALVGDRTDELAAAAGVAMPADRGRTADVYALGALLLRLVTASAPAGPALAALPVALRALLSAMLDEHPSRRPTADAVARALAGMREELLGTGPVDLPRSAPVPVPRATAPVPVAPAPRPVPQVAAQPVSAAFAASMPAPVPTPVAAPRTAPAPQLLAVPAPVRAPHTTESPILAPSVTPAPAPSLWTGPVRVAEPDRPGRRRAKRVLLLAGGVGLAGLVLGVVTHLPLGHAEGDQAVAAVAAPGGPTVAAAPASTGSASGSASTGSSTTRAPKHRATPAVPLLAPSSAPAFARPTKVVPSPLTASATSTTPSRNTTPPAPTGSHSEPSSSAPSSSAPGSGAPGSSAPSSSTPSSSAPSSSDPVTSDPVASRPADPQPSSDASTPSDSSTTTDPAPSADPTRADPAPSDSASTDPTPGDAATTDSASSAPTPSGSASD